jgi:hypothetical protein
VKLRAVEQLIPQRYSPSITMKTIIKLNFFVILLLFSSHVLLLRSRLMFSAPCQGVYDSFSVFMKLTK